MSASIRPVTEGVPKMFRVCIPPVPNQPSRPMYKQLVPPCESWLPHGAESEQRVDSTKRIHTGRSAESDRRSWLGFLKDSLFW